MKARNGSVIILAIVVVFAAVHTANRKAAAAQTSKPASGIPVFKVDPFWPKPLPGKLILGELGGVYVDAQDHVWIVSRPKTLTPDLIGASLKPPTAECCLPAPPVIEFDAAGNYLQGWGGPGNGYEWPDNPHGVFVDYKGNVWIGGNTTNKDNQIVKFTNDGKFLLQIGHAGKSQGSLDTGNLNRPTQVFVYQKTNEAFVSDGYQNRRVIVFDADTGAFKRLWGAYGNKPDDSASRTRPFSGAGSPQFNLVHGVSISHDDLVYVSDRLNNRLQVFSPDGKFIKEAYIARGTLDDRGTAFGVAFSPDREQKFLYLPNGASDKIEILDRQTLQIVGSFGRGGEFAGEWHWLHTLAVDSKGNIYTAESRGNRVQKFRLTGFSAATGSSSGT